MELGREKRWGRGGGFKVIIWGKGASHKGGTIFYGVEVNPSRNHAKYVITRIHNVQNKLLVVLASASMLFWKNKGYR